MSKHIFQGSCPDSDEDPARDPECPACYGIDMQRLWGEYRARCGCLWDVLPETMQRAVVCEQHVGTKDPLADGELEM
jgi:hypothetical protein